MIKISICIAASTQRTDPRSPMGDGLDFNPAIASAIVVVSTRDLSFKLVLSSSDAPVFR